MAEVRAVHGLQACFVFNWKWSIEFVLPWKLIFLKVKSHRPLTTSIFTTGINILATSQERASCMQVRLFLAKAPQ